jgi:lyso-ornithine lipid O-acyltransferase
MRVIYRCVRLVWILGVVWPIFFILGWTPSLRIALRKKMYQMLCRSFGIRRVTVEGSLDSHPHLVLMCNHVSYLDILVLGSVFPCRFVSKDDVQKWPVIGFYATSYQTIFVSRKKMDIRKGLNQLSQALREKAQVVLFPEGTTGDGCVLLPFKTSYFELESHIKIQPICLRYERCNGLPALRFFKKQLSWRGTLDLFTHFVLISKIRCIDVSIVVHPALQAQSLPRKQLAQQCFESIKKGLQP